MLHLLPKIFAAIGALLGAMSCYYTVYAIVGLFATRHFAPAKRRHRYAIVIAARNEEAVIGRLLESIRLQDYPSELLTVFVVADNCTDGTAQAARSGGAVWRSAMSAATRTTAQRATRWNICSPASRGTTERMPLRAILYLTQTICSTATMSRA